MKCKCKKNAKYNFIFFWFWFLGWNMTWTCFHSLIKKLCKTFIWINSSWGFHWSDHLCRSCVPDGKWAALWRRRWGRSRESACHQGRRSLWSWTVWVMWREHFQTAKTLRPLWVRYTIHFRKIVDEWKASPSHSLSFSLSQMFTLAEVCLKELESLCSLRAANESKLLPTADCSALKVCVCQKPAMGAMLQCELCRDAFHSVCVRGPSDPLDPEAWLCPLCLRSTKPPMDKILTLLSSLQRIRVRFPEGDALRYMIERTGSWQRRAREVIDSYDLSLTSQGCRVASPTRSHRTTGHNRKVRHYFTQAPDC